MGYGLILAPGAGCPPDMCTSWQHALQKRNIDATIATYPNHGVGEDPSGVTTCACEEHVESLILERGKKERPFLLLGHSFGGLVALRVAQNNPKVRGIILVAPAPPQGVSLGMVALIRLFMHSHVYTPAMLTGNAFEFHPDDIENRFLSGHAPIDEEGVRHSFGKESGVILRRLVLNKPPIEPESIRCPIHIFSGSDDRLFTLDVHMALRDYLNRSCPSERPRAFLHRLPGASHMPMFGPTAAPITSILVDQVEQLMAPEHTAAIAAE